MKKLNLPNVLLAILTLFIVGCEDNVDTEQNLDSLIGHWNSPELTDSLVVYSKSNKLADNNYGIVFNSDGTFIERKNSGWCGTPPISYSDFEGYWTKTDSIIDINVDFWGGTTNYQWKLIEIKDNKLVVYKMKEEYSYENNNSTESSINTIELKYGECETSFGQATFCFDTVLNDSRCPKDGTCVWEGNAKVKLNLSITGIGEYSIELNTNKTFSIDTTINKLNISLISLMPYPDISSAILPKDYSVKLSVVNLTTIESNGQILSFNPNKALCSWGWTIKMDNDTIKSDDVLVGETIGYEIAEPIDVYIQLGEKERDCSGLTEIDYYEIKRIFKVE